MAGQVYKKLRYQALCHLRMLPSLGPGFSSIGSPSAIWSLTTRCGFTLRRARTTLIFASHCPAAKSRADASGNQAMVPAWATAFVHALGRQLFRASRKGRRLAQTDHALAPGSNGNRRSLKPPKNGRVSLAGRLAADDEPAPSVGPQAADLPRLHLRRCAAPQRFGSAKTDSAAAAAGVEAAAAFEAAAARVRPLSLPASAPPARLSATLSIPPGAALAATGAAFVTTAFAVLTALPTAAPKPTADQAHRAQHRPTHTDQTDEQGIHKASCSTTIAKSHRAPYRFRPVRAQTFHPASGLTRCGYGCWSADHLSGPALRRTHLGPDP